MARVFAGRLYLGTIPLVNVPVSECARLEIVPIRDRPGRISYLGMAPVVFPALWIS
jgi:glutamate mutase epsilon subunit